VFSIWSNPRLYSELPTAVGVGLGQCPTWEYAADAHHLKLQHLQNGILHAIGNLHRCTPVSKLNVAFKIPYVYGCITKLCRTQDLVNVWYWTRRTQAEDV
jgi:hypothetical protein